jgi:two-component system, OmpR family, phosphate regulon sensor histidine kinase PhoR
VADRTPYDTPRTNRVFTFLIVPAIVVGVLVLGGVTFRTTFQIEKLRQQSVVEATISLANEKVDRLDKRIIEQDNVVLAEVDPTAFGTLAQRWLPIAARETPTVRAILVLSPESPTHDVLAFASRAGGGPEDDAFRRLLVERMYFDLALSREPVDELRHLHKLYGGQSYLVSYCLKTSGPKTHLVVAWHDVPRIVHDMLPRLFPDAAGASRANIVDEDGRIVFGPPLRGGEFTVGRPFPTTLYGWRLQVALTSAQELGARVERRRVLEMVMVALSCVVVFAGIAVVIVAAERERRLSALKSDFVANVSHELKTPLALVRMFAELLLSGRVPSDDKRREYLQIILNESERLTVLIENVLDFARFERGKSAFDFQPGDLGAVVVRAVDVYRHRAERENVELEVAIEPGLPIVSFDDRAIELLLMNLLDNALKYAKDGKVIRTEARSRAGVVELLVIDRGPGIAENERRRIFERFVRGTVGVERQVRGSGIGLALVKHIAESHGGSAWVESELGRGSTFVVTVPAQPPAAGVATRPEAR